MRVAVGLGSNVGDRRRRLDEAVDALAEIGELAAVSSYYETAPLGRTDQADFLNAVVLVDTELSARKLLDELLLVERQRGRERRERWGPRTLDLDILLYGDRTIDEPGLKIPHPRMADRRFVLEPLAEVWPDAAMPDGTSVADLLAAVEDQEIHLA